MSYQFRRCCDTPADQKFEHLLGCPERPSMTERSQPIDKDAVEAVIERLNDEAMRLAGRGIDRGCVDSSLAANLALEAAAMLEALAQPTEQTKPCGCKSFEVCSECEDFGLPTEAVAAAAAALRQIEAIPITDIYGRPEQPGAIARRALAKLESRQ